MAFPNSPLDVRWVVAFGADLTLAGTPSSWSWKDCTSDLMTDGFSAANLKVGKSDRATQQEPNNATFTLKNFQGQYTVDNPAGVNYPNVVENVPGIIAVRRNLNATFEVDASDWTATNGSVARSTVRAFSGSGSLLLTPNGSATSQAAVTAAIPVRPGGNVFVDAWVFSVAGWPTVAIAVDWYSDLAGTALISSTSGTVTNVGASVWTYLADLLGPAPSNALSCKGKVLMTGTPAAGNTLWIDETRTSIPRLCGYVDGWTPQFDDSSRVVTCAVSLSSVRRRLNQGSALLRSALYRAITTSSVQPTAYWPCEDGADRVSVDRAVSPIAGVAPMLATGASNFAADAGAPGSDKQPNFGAGGSLTGFVPGTGGATSWRIQCLVKANAITSPAFAVPISWDTADGNGWELDLNALSAGGLVYSDTLLNTFNSGVAVDDGQWHELRVTATQSGGNIIINVFVDGALVINQTIAGTVTRIVKVFANPDASTSNIISGVGHFAVWNNTISTPGLDTVDSMRGHAGETAGARITRLATEELVPLATIANQTNSMPMGPQGIQSFLAHMDECEAADMGVLCDPFDSFGMGYTVRSDLHNQSVTLTLDHAQHQVGNPFVPVMDDALRRNDITVTRTNGSFARYTGDTSRGTYQDTATLNVARDGLLYNIAAWRVHVGTPISRLRFPSLGVNYGRSTATALAATWMASLGVGKRVQVTNLPATMPPGAIDILTTGYTEVLAAKAWSMAILGVPYNPWIVGALNTSLRLELASQTLAANLVAGATSLSLATAAGHQLFTTTAKYPADFPLDLNVAGWQIHVTAATGTSSPQTLTIDPSPNTATIPSTTPVTLWRPAALAL